MLASQSGDELFIGEFSAAVLEALAHNGTPVDMLALGSWQAQLLRCASCLQHDAATSALLDAFVAKMAIEYMGDDTRTPGESAAHAFTWLVSLADPHPSKRVACVRE